METTKGKFNDAADAMAFILAGNATITVVSKKTETRRTFKVRQPNDGSPHFVKVMTGSDNEGSFTYLGTIFDKKTYKHGARSPIDKGAVSAVAFKWLWEELAKGSLPAQAELWHEGSCGRCGRKLTVPESIANGIGPECNKMMGRVTKVAATSNTLSLPPAVVQDMRYKAEFTERERRQEEMAFLGSM